MTTASRADGINPFGTTEFLETWWDYNTIDARRLNEFTGHSYLQRAFCERAAWKVGRVIETCGAGAADYTELDWRMVSPAQFRKFLEAFRESRRADLLVLPRVRMGCLVGKLTATFAGEFDLPFFRHRYDVAPYVLMDGDWESYYARKGKKFRYNLRRAERKLDGMGGLQFLHVTRPGEVERYMERAFQLYARRSQNCYRGAQWSTPAGRQLVGQLARRFAGCGWMDLTFLLVGGELVAFSYGFQNQVDYYFYATAFNPDPRYSAYSPGVVLIKHLIQKAFESGFRHFDFMLGDEPYKETWATHSQDVCTYVIGNRTARSRAAFFFYCQLLRVRQTIRRSPALRAAVEKVIHGSARSHP